MLQKRIIPCLLLRNESLVKTVKFKKFEYIGDPANTCRIFNELEVDELIFLDIMASRENRGPNFTILQEIADECFMPLSYGGGIRDVYTAERIFKTGFEKIVLNTYPFENPTLINELSKSFGAQSVIVAIDVRKNFWKNYQIFSLSGSRKQNHNLVDWAREVEDRGAGEIIITSIDKEGTWQGFDLELVRLIADSVSVPVVANGGAGSIRHIGDVIHQGGASAVALGSMVVYQKKDFGVLVNFPDRTGLERVINNG